MSCRFRMDRRMCMLSASQSSVNFPSSGTTWKLFQRIEHLIGKKLPVFPAGQRGHDADRRVSLRPRDLPNGVQLVYLFIFGCAGFSSLRRLSLVAASWGYSLVPTCEGFSLWHPSLVAEHRLCGASLSSCDTWTPEHRFSSCGSELFSSPETCGIFPDQDETMSPALAGSRFFTMEPPGKPLQCLFSPASMQLNCMQTLLSC